VSGRAAALRQAFDASFAEPARPAGEGLVSLLTIRVGGDPYAVRLSECAAVHAGRKIAPLPSDAPGLLGLAGFRGSLLPVYDLRVLLGSPGGGGAPRWLLVASGVAPVAIAFDLLEAHLRVAAHSLIADAAPSPFSDCAVRLPDGARRVLRLASVVRVIEERAPRAPQGA
jgi:chemotaxis signal transduction protein